MAGRTAWVDSGELGRYAELLTAPILTLWTLLPSLLVAGVAQADLWRGPILPFLRGSFL